MQPQQRATLIARTNYIEAHRSEMGDLITVRDICEMFKVQKSTVRTWRNRASRDHDVFPNPLVNGAHTMPSLWRREEVVAWDADRQVRTAKRLAQPKAPRKPQVYLPRHVAMPVATVVHPKLPPFVPLAKPRSSGMAFYKSPVDEAKAREHAYLGAYQEYSLDRQARHSS